jgi:precorrin-3B synthase
LSHASSTPPRLSACPALSRIVDARDGGLCRVKLPCGELRADQAFALAEAAETHASGIIELTNRANLQLRGVRSGEASRLVERLLRARLGPHLGEAADEAGTERNGVLAQRLASADDVRNLMTNPGAGRDAHASYDTRPLAREILHMLQHEPRFAALSPKFALLLDGGERLAVLDHAHDIWLCAMPAEDAQAWFAFGLAGRPSIEQRCAAGAVRDVDVPALVRGLIDTFLDLAEPHETRLRETLARCGIDAFLNRLRARIACPLRSDSHPAVSAWRRAPADPRLRFGAHEQHTRGFWHVGAQPALGRIDPATLRALARLARDCGDGTLRMTPWQSVLLPDIASEAVSTVEAGLDAIGLLRDAAHPLARAIACAGSPGCSKSHADTKADALALAALLPDDIEVHLSGCVRSCAAAHCAPYTLLAVEPGRYDLYRRSLPGENEPARSAPIASSTDGALAARRFGRRIATHLTIEEAAVALGTAARRSDPHA